MKKILLSAALFLSFPIYSQQADERIGNLINQSDWFGLEATYPILKDSMQVDFLKLLSEVMIGNYFNRPKEALAGIEHLLTNHQAEIGSGNALNLALLTCQIEGNMGNYVVAADRAKNIMEQVKVQGGSPEAYSALQAVYRFYDKLRETPAPKVDKPATDISIPITIEKVKLPDSIDPKGWRGTHILIPVTIHGNKYRFIFDTGAGTSYMSEQFARKVGVRIVNDSLMINQESEGAAWGKMGTLDSMQIGDITFRNSLIAVAPPNKLDSIMMVDAVLGMDFICMFDEFRIYPKDCRIAFPATPGKRPLSGRNLLLTDKALKLRAESKEESLQFHFDTGCTTAGLYYNYYNRHKEELETIGKRETRIGGGFNVISKNEILCLPAFTMTIGGTEVELQNLSVNIDESGFQVTGDDGIMGMDLVNQFHCVVVNLKDMFLELKRK